MKQILYGLILDNGNLVIGKSKKLDGEKMIIKEGTIFHKEKLPANIYLEDGRYNEKIKRDYLLENFSFNTGNIYIPTELIQKPYDLLGDKNGLKIKALGLNFI